MSRVAVRAPLGARGGAAGPLRVARLRARLGAVVRAGQLLLEWRAEPGAEGPAPAPLRAPLPGSVAKILAAEGDLLEPGQAVLEIEACSHPTVMKDMCADCGADLRADDNSTTNIAIVPMVHSVPELKVSEELAQKIGKEDSDRLLRDRKLVLLVDLDQTLIHTTNDNIPPNIKDVHHFRLKSWGPGGYGGGRWYHTRLRPGTLKFLKKIAKSYELHICTFGARAYAHQVAELLDPNGELFSHRILSRDECFDIHTKTPNLRALFPCGDNLVCIIDDREDVWNRAANLIQVKPYHFFEHTGDINAPPGLEKMERDAEGQGMHLEDMNSKSEETKSETKDESSHLSSESKEGAEVSSEMPSLDSEPKDDPSDLKNEKPEAATETPKNDQEASVASDEDKKYEILPMETKDDKQDLIPEIDSATIVKDIEKIVSKVQENFMNPEPKTKGDSQNKNNHKVSVPETTSDGENSPVQPPRTKWKITQDGMIDVEDGDDYLMYLEEILTRIHTLFYEIYDGMEAGSVPDLKVVIPKVKSQVLSGTSLVFSGLVPTHQKLEHSRAYMVAQSLGAEVTQDFTERTTHLVAVRPGTAKVHACRRVAALNGGKTPHTVTPAWLWCCAERWQHVEEKLFPLRGNTRLPRKPPPHCGSPPRVPLNQSPSPRRRTPSGRFMDTINPLLSFSSDDIANMDKEVEDMINESDESDSDTKLTSGNGNAGEERLADETQQDILRDDLGNISSGSDDSIPSLSGEYPHGWKPEKPRKRRRSGSSVFTDDEKSGSTPSKKNKDNDALKISDDTLDPSDEEFPSEKFKRGEPLPSDHNESDTNGSEEPNDDIDDGEWNMMGAALEREFLGLDD